MPGIAEISEDSRVIGITLRVHCNIASVHDVLGVLGGPMTKMVDSLSSQGDV